MTDVLAIALRGLAYAAVLQAAGAAIFVQLFGTRLELAHLRVATSSFAAATVGLIATLAHALAEPARLTGGVSGAFDPSIHAMLLRSDFGTVLALRLLGLLVLIGLVRRSNRLGESARLVGAALILASFAFMGHTATAPQRWALAPLLLTHLVAVAFWFGGLSLLLTVVRFEAAATAGRVIAGFSRVAARLVPILLLAGVAVAGLLLPGWSSLRTPYGALLLAKIGGFALLMLLASANRWRFGPRVGRGDTRAVDAFRHTVQAEWILIFAIVIGTAAMTALFSPGH